MGWAGQAHGTNTTRYTRKTELLRTHLLHRSPCRVALVEDSRGVVPVGEVLGDLPQRGEHADASVLELRGAVPLHLLGGAVLAEAEGVEGPAGLDVVAHEPVHRVGGDGAGRRRLALLRRHLKAVFLFVGLLFSRSMAVVHRFRPCANVRGCDGCGGGVGVGSETRKEAAERAGGGFNGKEGGDAAQHEHFAVRVNAVRRGQEQGCVLANMGLFSVRPGWDREGKTAGGCVAMQCCLKSPCLICARIDVLGILHFEVLRHEHELHLTA